MLCMGTKLVYSYGLGNLVDFRYNHALDHLEKYKHRGGKYEKIVGSSNGLGYHRVTVGGKKIVTHRIVYEVVHGKIPEGLHVDHINNVRNCNSISNLQLLNNRDNVSKNSKGTRPNKVGNRWKITVNAGKAIHLGSYLTESEALLVCNKYDNLFGYKKKYYDVLVDLGVDANVDLVYQHIFRPRGK